MRDLAIEIDLNKMEQVLRNFLTNALKFTPKGGTVRVRLISKSNFTSKTSVTCVLNEDEKVLRCEVIDSGAGISKVN